MKSRIKNLLNKRDFLFYFFFFLSLLTIISLSGLVFIIPLRKSNVVYPSIEVHAESLPVDDSTEETISKSSANFNEDYDYPPVEQAVNSVRIPILTYHQIGTLPSELGKAAYFVTPEMFDKQMDYLNDKGYVTLTPYELYEQLKIGKNPVQKSVVLTFDDGNYNNYENAFPILKKYGFIGVFYINSSKSGIPFSKLREMSDAGMVIDSHSATHVDLRPITDTGILTTELSGSKFTLQAVTGKTVYSFCYPGCGSNSTVVSILSSNGYLLGMSCGKTIDHRIGGRFGLSRRHVYNNFENFKKILSGIYEFTSDYSE